MTSNRTAATFVGSIAKATFGAPVGYPTWLTRTSGALFTVLGAITPETADKSRGFPSAGAADVASVTAAATAAVAAPARVKARRRLVIGISSSPGQVSGVFCDQSVGQALNLVGLAHQRMREQRVVHPVPPAADGGVEREFLV